MKIKLSQNEVTDLEVFVLDTIESKKMKRVKYKFLNSIIEDKFITVHLSNDEYLFILDSIELKMCNEVMSIYHKLVMQESKGLIKPIYIQSSIL
jgi:hypothetical protein